MGDQAVIYVNTGLLIFIVTMLITFGRWLVFKLHALDLKVDKNCLRIDGLAENVTKNMGAVGDLKIGLAVHAAGPHCGEDDE